MPQKRKAPSVHSDGDEGDEDYRTKRDRNNQAVKKSRVKSKQKTIETQDRVRKLKVENKVLEEKISNHKKTLTLLKELFFTNAKGKPDRKMPAELKEILEDDDADEDGDNSSPAITSSTNRGDGASGSGSGSSRTSKT